MKGHAKLSSASPNRPRGPSNREAVSSLREPEAAPPAGQEPKGPVPEEPLSRGIWVLGEPIIKLPNKGTSALEVLAGRHPT